MPASLRAPVRVKLVTINTWKCDGDYAQRLQALRIQLKELDADIIALQESFSTANGTVDTARCLAQALGLTWHTVLARRKPRWHQGQWVDSFSSQALLSAWPIRAAAAIELPSSPSDGGRWAQVCSVEVEGRRVGVANVHLSHLRDDGALRARQMRAILTDPLLRQAHDLALVCGDFNAPLSSDELSPFLKAPWHLVDAFRRATGADKVTCRGADGQWRDLDHILCLPDHAPCEVTLEDAGVVLHAPLPGTDVCPSDHHGVSVNLRIR